MVYIIIVLLYRIEMGELKMEDKYSKAYKLEDFLEERVFLRFLSDGIENESDKGDFEIL